MAIEIVQVGVAGPPGPPGPGGGGGGRSDVGWAAVAEPPTVPAEFFQWSAAFAESVDGDEVWNLRPTRRFDDRNYSLTSEVNGFNPGPIFDEDGGPDGGPALVFNGVEKGDFNPVLRYENTEPTFAIIFVPTGPTYTLLAAGEAAPEYGYVASCADGVFTVANGDNSVAYTFDAPDVDEPHMLVVSSSEYAGEAGGPGSYISLDGETNYNGVLWTDPESVLAFNGQLNLSNIVDGGDPVKVLWVAAWDANEDPDIETDYHVLAETYAVQVGVRIAD